MALCIRMVSLVVVFTTSVFTAPQAFAMDQKKCIQAVVEATTIPTPTRPAPTRPIPQPNPAPQPYQPRRVPVPKNPDAPPRKIPVKPLEDPKDILPEELYETDKKVTSFWNEMPVGLRRLMIEGARTEKKALEAHIAAKYGRADAITLTRVTLSLQAEIERLEVVNKPRILEVIRRMIETRYGEKVQGLKVGITSDKPIPKGNSGDARTSVPELPIEYDSGMIYRTEVRNLWQQGEGWIGMQEFAFGMATELDQISPGLAGKYQELDKLYRLLQLVALDQVPDARMFDVLTRDGFSEMSAGREIVTTRFEMQRDPNGDEFVALSSVEGIAVGRNGWAAAHEARKAAAQMATPMEGAYRWMMDDARRRALELATNSARAELRQGIFGPQVVRALRKRLAVLFSDERANQIADPDYHHVIDGLFSMEPGAFKVASKLLFDSEFDQNPARRAEAREFLFRHGVLPRTGEND